MLNELNRKIDKMELKRSHNAIRKKIDKLEDKVIDLKSAPRVSTSESGIALLNSNKKCISCFRDLPDKK